MLKGFRQVYLTNRFFWAFGGLILCFVLGFPVPILFPIAQALGVLLLALIFLDIFLLFGRQVDFHCERQAPKLLNLGDSNTIRLSIENQGGVDWRLKVLDELPIQFQIRDFEESLVLPAGAEKKLSYTVRPVKRGAYFFGKLHLFIRSFLGLLERRLSYLEDPMEVPVYPSILQMKNMELMAFNRISTRQGIKRIRRIGHSYEFEQIKNYVRGDDYRSVNWKASSRRHSLMVNQYQDERSQQVYCVIDKSRVMRMPFNDLSLIDYAINASLVISNIALQKYDKAGLITFSDKLGATLKADSKATQLNKILSALYKEKERSLEANYDLLYYASRKLISGRSLLLLFTNFESNYALERVLPVLRRINRMHLLVVIFFENTEVRDFARQPADTLEDIYHQTIAEKFLSEKAQMVHKLRQYGIQSILTPPRELSINTVNKYLELKSRGLI